MMDASTKEGVRRPITVGTRQVAANAGWSFLGFAWPTSVMLVGIPVFIHFLGQRGYGLWTLANAVLGLVGILNLGLGDATTKYVAEHSAKGEWQEVTGVIFATLFIYSALGIVGTFALWLLAPLIAGVVFGLSGAEAERAIVVFHVVAVGFAPSVSMTAVLGIFNGLQRYRISQTLLIVRSTAVVVIGGVVLFLGQGIVGLVTTSVAVVWAVWLTALVLGLRQLPGLSFRVVGLRYQVKKVLGFGMYSTVTTAGIMAAAQLDKVLIGSLLGLEAVTYYSIPQAVASKVNSFCASAAKVLMPFFSSRSASADGASLAAPLFRGWRVSLLLSLGVLAPAAASAAWLLHVWLGPEIAAHALSVYLVFLAVYSLYALNIVPYYFLLGLGRPDVVAKTTLLAGISVLIGIVVLVRTLDVLGAAIAGLVYPLFLMNLGRMAVGLTPGASVWEGLLPGFWLPLSIHAMAAGLGLFAGWTMAVITGSSWGGLAGSLVVSTLVIISAYLLLRRSPNPYFRDVWSIVSTFLGGRMPRSFQT